jgi:hypothetical protein
MRNTGLRLGIAVPVAMILLSGCFTTQSIADGQLHKGMRHARSGWGWDSRSGWYAGPIFGRSGHGYFRCYDPGFGWHRCPHYLPASAAPKPPKGWWRYHLILPN